MTRTKMLRKAHERKQMLRKAHERRQTLIIAYETELKCLEKQKKIKIYLNQLQVIWTS